MKEYFLGNATFEEALEAFKVKVKAAYPDVNVDTIKR